MEERGAHPARAEGDVWILHRCTPTAAAPPATTGVCRDVSDKPRARAPMDWIAPTIAPVDSEWEPTVCALSVDKK